MKREVELIAEPGDRVEVRGPGGFWTTGVRAGTLLYVDVRHYRGGYRTLYKVDFDNGQGNPDQLYVADDLRPIRKPQQP